MDKNWKVIKVGNVLTVRGDYFDPPRKPDHWYILGIDEDLPPGAQDEEVHDFFEEAPQAPPSTVGRNSGISMSRLTFGF